MGEKFHKYGGCGISRAKTATATIVTRTRKRLRFIVAAPRLVASENHDPLVVAAGVVDPVPQTTLARQPRLGCAHSGCGRLPALLYPRPTASLPWLGRRGTEHL